MLVLSSDSLNQNIGPINKSRLGTGPVDGPNVLMEGVKGQHENHNKQNNDKEEKTVGLQFCFYNYYNHTLLPVPANQIWPEQEPCIHITLGHFVPCSLAFFDLLITLGQGGLITLHWKSGANLGPLGMTPYSPIKLLEFCFQTVVAVGYPKFVDEV